MTPDEFGKLRDYIYRKTGLYFDDKKLYYVERRVEERMRATGMDRFGAYFNWLRFEPSQAEFQQLLNALTVNETYFFREYDQLRCFAEEALPELLAACGGGSAKRLRVWSAGCSTGEEAYTLAIILKEMTEGLPTGPVHWEVHATDLNTEVLETARRGVYGRRAVRGVPEVYLQRYFTCCADGLYRVSETLRAGVRFYPLNLLDREAMRTMRDFDAIFCRNVLIYFDDASRRQVALYFYEALRPGGFIFLGHSESMSRIAPIFRLRRFNNAIIYQK
ncbi:MAG: CheR family methyltransferase [Moorellales bacterium]